MSDLKYWKQKIIEKRKSTNFEDFILEIGSWSSYSFQNNNGLISRFPDTDRIKICHFSKFNENRADYYKDGIDYDFDLDFFGNFEKVFKNTELPNVFHVGENENADYVDTAVNCKNAYLSFMISWGSENVCYSYMVREASVNVFNSTYIIANNQNIYNSTNVSNSYNIFYSRFIKNSSNTWFSSNLTGCRECVFCDDLMNSSYYINNEQYEKEEYFKKKEEILSHKDMFQDYYCGINKKGNNYNSTNVTGSSVIDSEDIENGIGVINIKQGRNLLYSGSLDDGKNCYDMIFGGKGTNDCYAASNFGGNPDNIFIGYNIGFSSNIFYCYGCEASSFLLGCVGLQNQKYCILNKQYTKDDWLKMVDKIFTKMLDEDYPINKLNGESRKAFGEYFPPTLNPLYFNDSFAFLLGDYKKEEIKEKGFLWRDKEVNVDVGDDSNNISTSDLDNFEGFDSDGTWRINPEILKKVIKDDKGNYYRIVQMEYDFLMKYCLPLPKLHWIDRMKVNFSI